MNKILLICFTMGAIIGATQAADSDKSVQTTKDDIFAQLSLILSKVRSYLVKKTEVCSIVVPRTKDVSRTTIQFVSTLIDVVQSVFQRIKGFCSASNFFTCYRSQIYFVYNRSNLNVQYIIFKASIINILKSLVMCSQIFV